MKLEGVTKELMIVRFLGEVSDDDLTRKLHGTKGEPKTREEIMEISKAFVQQEKICNQLSIIEEAQ